MSVSGATTGLAVYAGIEINGPETAISVAKTVGLDSLVNLESLNPTFGNIALAVALNEALEIVRLPFVISTTPRVSKFLETKFGYAAKGSKPGRFATLMKEHGTFFLVSVLLKAPLPSVYVIRFTGQVAGLFLELDVTVLFPMLDRKQLLISFDMREWILTWQLTRGILKLEMLEWPSL